MSERELKPLVGIPCCLRQINIYDYHVVGEKYVRAIVRAAGAIPVLIPAMDDALELHEILQHLDGVFFTGSPSNVAPHHYGGPAFREGVMEDARRDALTLPLIRAAVERGVPSFGVCRGYQEFNVALGGSLHQHVQEVPGMLDHREDETVARAARYEPCHPVALAEGGLLAGLLGKDEIEVNSLHNQGVNALAPPLIAEATAPDGLVEAFRVADAPGFTLGTQWHPEWEVMDDPDSVKIFAAFGDAVREHAAKRRREGRPSRTRPLVGTTCDVTDIGIHPFEAVAEVFLTAVHDAADCLPVGIPSLPGELDYDGLLEHLDGIFLSGGASMVNPAHYGEEPFEDEMILDPVHDDAILPLIRDAVARSVPVFGVCRGIQELNVAYGGSLIQEIANVDRLENHHPNFGKPLDERFAPAHKLIIEPDSLLAELSGETETVVNSAHRQGVRGVGDGLVVEARSADGMVEALRVADSATFAYGAQWHPEYKWRQSACARGLFSAFGKAARERAAKREGSATREA
jgi:putative glutamine amidotransferase